MKRITRSIGKAFFCGIAMAALLVSTPVLGHDPLEDQDNDAYDHHASQHPNLSEVRGLIDLFRQSGADHHLDYARILLEPSLASTSPDPETLVVASFVAQARHEFEYAADLVNRSLAINANNDEAWLLLASIHLVTGDTESATRACRQLRNVPPLVLLTCKGRVALASGKHKTAFQRLNAILKLPDARQLPPEILAWSYSVSGDLAKAAGFSDRAVDLYKRSLALAERTQVRAALVDVLLSLGKHEEAWDTLDEGSQALPLLVRRLIVAKHVGQTQSLQSTMVKVEQEFDRWIASEDWLHAREMARFFIDVKPRPGLARRLAVINLSLQNELEDKRLEMRTRNGVNDA